MEKALLLQGKIPKLQQLFGKNWLQYGRACCQSRLVGGRLSKSVLQNDTAQLYFILGTVKLHWNFSIIPEDGSDIHRLSNRKWFSTMYNAEICEYRRHP